MATADMLHGIGTSTSLLGPAIGAAPDPVRPERRDVLPRPHEQLAGDSSPPPSQCGRCGTGQCPGCAAPARNPEHLRLEWARLLTEKSSASLFWRTAIGADAYLSPRGGFTPDPQSVTTRTVVLTRRVVSALSDLTDRRGNRGPLVRISIAPASSDVESTLRGVAVDLPNGRLDGEGLIRTMTQPASVADGGGSRRGETQQGLFDREFSESGDPLIGRTKDPVTRELCSIARDVTITITNETGGGRTVATVAPVADTRERLDITIRSEFGSDPFESGLAVMSTVLFRGTWWPSFFGRSFFPVSDGSLVKLLRLAIAQEELDEFLKKSAHFGVRSKLDAILEEHRRCDFDLTEAVQEMFATLWQARLYYHAYGYEKGDQYGNPRRERDREKADEIGWEWFVTETAFKKLLNKLRIQPGPYRLEPRKKR